MRKIDPKKAFGASVKTWRSRRGFSQEELAERAELHRTYISSVERGGRNISLENIEKLAGALNISSSELFSESGLEEQKAVQSNGHHNHLVDVLLVEDNIREAELALRAFKKVRLANRIHLARSGAEALDFIFRQGNFADRQTNRSPQVILLNLNLSGLSAFEVLRRLHSDKHARTIPVVVLTKSADHCDVAECRRLGVRSYIVKPLDFHRLSRATPELDLHWALLKASTNNAPDALA